MFKAFNMSGKDGHGMQDMAVQVMRHEINGEHEVAVGMCTAVREGVVAMVLAMALVTQVQDPDNPILLLRSEDLGTDETKYTPAELLQALVDGFEHGVVSENWDLLVEKFTVLVNELKIEKDLKGLPEELTVDDILGGK